MAKGFDVKAVREALGPDPEADPMAGIAAMRAAKGIPTKASGSPQRSQGWSPTDADPAPALDERRRWSSMTEQERAEVLDRAERARLEREAEHNRLVRLDHLRKLHAASGVPEIHDDERGLAKPWVPLPYDVEAQVWDAISLGLIVLLVGPMGRGKSRLLCRMVQRFINDTGRPARYMTTSEFMRARQAEFGSKPQIVNRLIYTGLLAFDEIDKAARTAKGAAWVKSELFEVFDGRYSRRLPLLLAGNSATIFEDEPGDAIQYGALMADRMRERGVVIDVSGWDSHRGAKA